MRGFVHVFSHLVDLWLTAPARSLLLLRVNCYQAVLPPPDFTARMLVLADTENSNLDLMAHWRYPKDPLHLGVWRDGGQG